MDNRWWSGCERQIGRRTIRTDTVVLAVGLRSEERAVKKYWEEMSQTPML